MRLLPSSEALSESESNPLAGGSSQARNLEYVCHVCRMDDLTGMTTFVSSQSCWYYHSRNLFRWDAEMSHGFGRYLTDIRMTSICHIRRYHHSGNIQILARIGATPCQDSVLQSSHHLVCAIQTSRTVCKNVPSNGRSMAYRASLFDPQALH